MRARGLAKTAAATLCRVSGADRVVSALSGARAMPFVLAYHRVVEDFEARARRSISAMLVSTRILEQHLDWVGRRYRVVSLDDLGGRLEDGGAGGFAAITFDDGYRDVYENALPLLRRKGLPAAAFVVTDIVGTTEIAFHDRFHCLVSRALRRWGSASALLRVLAGNGVGVAHLRELAESGPLAVMTRLLVGLSRAEAERAAAVLEGNVGLPAEDIEGMLPLTWEMLAEMRRAGMTIGSHTRSHALLTGETRDRLRDEVAGSRAEIERRLGAECLHFAYPDGRWNGATVEALRAGGYRFAYTTCWHRHASDPSLTVPRTPLWQRSSLDAFGRFSPAIMGSHASGLFRLARSCGRDHGNGRS